MLDLIVKDLKRVLRDKKALAIILVMPIILMTILGFTVGKFMMDSSAWIGHVKIGIVNLDNREDLLDRVIETFSAIGIEDNSSNRNGLEEINDIDLVKGLLDIFEVDEIKSFMSYEIFNEQDAMEKLETGELNSVVFIPKDFTYNTLLSLATPFTQRQEIEVIVNKNSQFSGRIVEEIVGGYTNVISTSINGKNSILEVGAELGVGDSLYSEVQDAVSKLHAGNSILGIKIEDVATMRAINGMQYYAVAQGMMFVLYVIGFFAKYALDEKHNHTHDRLILSNLSANKMLLSLGISSGIIVLLQILIFSIYSSLVFKISWGNPANVFILSVFVALATAGMTILISAINMRTSNAKISNMFDAVVVIILSVLGGSFVPLSGAPTLERIGRLTPNGAAINGFLKIMQGYGLKEIFPALIVLCLVFITCFMSSKIVVGRGGA